MTQQWEYDIVFYEIVTEAVNAEYGREMEDKYQPVLHFIDMAQQYYPDVSADQAWERLWAQERDEQ